MSHTVDKAQELFKAAMPDILQRLAELDRTQAAAAKDADGYKAYFAHKVAAVTGGASGIGLALCEKMLELGAHAVVLADINQANLDTHVARLGTQYPGKVFGIVTDVTNEESVTTMVHRAKELGGRLDFLFNNAGAGLDGRFTDTSVAAWKRAFDLNFFGALYGTRAAVPLMQQQGSGHIANTASGIAYCALPYQSMYSATKAALLGMTSALRAELKESGLSLSTIIPGTVATAIWGNGPAPDFAMRPATAAERILCGMAANRRVIFTCLEDRVGACASLCLPDVEAAFDEMCAAIARARSGGNFSAF